MPHPFTSLSYCPDAPVCVSTGDFMVSSICLTPLVFWSGRWASAMSWKLMNLVPSPAKDNRSLQTWFHLLFFFISFCFAYSPIPTSGFVLLCPPVLLFAPFSCPTSSEWMVVMTHFLCRCVFLSVKTVFRCVCDWDNLFPVAFVRILTGRVSTCWRRRALTCLHLHTTNCQFLNVSFFHLPT